MNRYEYRYTCEINASMCQFAIEPDEITDSTKPLYIAFLTKSGFKVMAAPKGQLLTEIKAFTPIRGKLPIKANDDEDIDFRMPFVFDPNWKNYKGSHRSDDQVYIALSTDEQNAEFLKANNDIDLVVYATTVPFTEAEKSHADRISIKDGIFKSTEEGIGARKHKIVKALDDSLLYITVICDGYGCGNPKLTQSSLYF